MSSSIQRLNNDWNNFVRGDEKFIFKQELLGVKMNQYREDIRKFQSFIPKFLENFHGIDNDTLSKATMEIDRKRVLITVDGVSPIEVSMDDIPGQKVSMITSLFPHLYSNKLIRFVFPKTKT